MEKNRTLNMCKRIPGAKSIFEIEAWSDGTFICGVDEVGRGCLAGPVVTSAVILERNKTFSLLRDSKLLTREERVRGAKWIKQHSWYAYGVVGHHDIDRFNIYQATILAMKRAVLHVLAKVPRFSTKIIVDAMPLRFSHEPFSSMDVVSFPFAEQQSISVAAASILAKVKRDELMSVYGRIFPGYALGKHKGYATRMHSACVIEQGRSLIHRQTFLKKLYERNDDSGERQIELFC